MTTTKLERVRAGLRRRAIQNGTRQAESELLAFAVGQVAQDPQADAMAATLGRYGFHAFGPGAAAEVLMKAAWWFNENLPPEEA